VQRQQYVQSEQYVQRDSVSNDFFAFFSFPHLSMEARLLFSSMTQPFSILIVSLLKRDRR
jgi:hypothetical protein